MQRSYRIIFMLLAIVSSANSQQKASDPAFIQKQFRKALDETTKARARSPQLALLSPRSVRHDTLFLVPTRDWTSGFFAGNLWLTYELTGDPFWKSQAIEFTAPLEAERTNGRTHDMGFKMYCSFGQGYRLTKDPRYKQILLEAARTLTTRFNANVGCIRSWDHNQDKWKFPVIIDNMMNLELLFWAFRESGDSSFYKIAVSHADVTLKNHFRADNSSYHVVDYNANDGAVVVKQTHQGYSDESAWARGQAWALYGYTVCYRETGLKRYLDQAVKVASFIFDHQRLPKDMIPYWDFDAPCDEWCPRDASAASVSASALIELSGYDTHRSSEYMRLADRLVKTLASDYANRSRYARFGFLLDHSTGHLPAQHEIDVPIVYADYYFMEALVRMKNTEGKR